MMGDHVKPQLCQKCQFNKMFASCRVGIYNDNNSAKKFYIAAFKGDTPDMHDPSSGFI